MLVHPNVVDLEFSLVAQYPICQMTNWLQIIKSKVQKFRQIIPPVQARPEAEMPCRVFPSGSPKQKNLWCLIGYRKANQILLSTMTTFQLTTSKAVGALRALPRIYWERPQVRSKTFAQPKNGKKNFIFIALVYNKFEKKGEAKGQIKSEWIYEVINFPKRLYRLGTYVCHCAPILWKKILFLTDF